MKYNILLVALCLGILIGLTIFVQPETLTITGKATINCYVENELCECNEKECVCGNKTVPAEYCKNN